jgi:hypothetical protein
MAPLEAKGQANRNTNSDSDRQVRKYREDSRQREKENVRFPLPEIPAKLVWLAHIPSGQHQKPCQGWHCHVSNEL